MRPYFHIVFILFLTLGVATCAPVTPAVQEATPTLQPAPAEPYHPLTSRTGIESIDAILEAVASGDMQSLRSLVEFTNAKCTTQDGLGGPPKCLEGEAEATLVDVLAFLGSEGGFLRKAEINNWPGVEASGVYAVYEVSPAVTSEQYYPVGKYVILFVTEENQSAAAIRIGERGIVRVDDILGSSPESLRATVEREASTVILPPKN
jgi:hypothetical protein